ncbi:hypothetical protein [Nonomuraea sp. NPDC046570]|uniref:hypothetical protein n=1 Tax=Nonomuraea sp. NPDC046570 TaxID=3155255 RepID=UPI0033E11A32
MRWSDAAAITLLHGQPDLPEAWWRSLPVPRVLAAIGPESLGELLTEIALEQWPAAAVGDVLPALHVLDPDEADDPHVAIALDRAGSWPGLLSLTSRELMDQPFIQARPVLNTLFTAVFVRLSPTSSPPRPDSRATPESRTPEVRVTSEAHTPEAGVTPEAPVTPEAGGAPAPQAPSAPQADLEASFAAQADSEPQADYAPASARQAEPEAVVAAWAEPEAISAPQTEPESTAAPEPEFPSAETPQAPEPEVLADADAHAEPDSLASPHAESEQYEPHSESEAPASPQAEAEPHAEPEVVASPQAESEDEPQPEPPNEALAVEAEPHSALEPELFSAPEPAALAAEAAPEPEAPKAPESVEVDPAPVQASDAIEAEAVANEAVAEAVAADAAARTGAEAGAGAVVEEPESDRAPEPVRVPEPVGAGQERDLHALIEAAFTGLDDTSWAVAQNRVFTDTPSAPEQLAKLFAVPKDEIAAVEGRLRHRVQRWLDSEEAAPYREHLDGLRRRVGPRPAKEQVIGAAGWHTKDIRALDVPAWQFVMATLQPAAQSPQSAPQPSAPRASMFEPVRPKPPAHEPPPFEPPMPEPPRREPPAPIGEIPGEQGRVDEFGMAVPPGVNLGAPPLSGMGVPPGVNMGAPPGPLSPPPGPLSPPPGPLSPPPGGVPTPPGAVAPPGSNGVAREEYNRPYQPLKDVSLTRRCFRLPDGRWYLRVDITADHLAGGEFALPTGFAAYLGLSPGESQVVRSAAGELTMSWHGRPVLESMDRLLADVGAQEGGHLFLTLSKEGVLRARHLPVAAQSAGPITKALRLVSYTAPNIMHDQAARIIATRIGMSGTVEPAELKTRLRERGDRDLLSLLD